MLVYWTKYLSLVMFVFVVETPHTLYLNMANQTLFNKKNYSGLLCPLVFDCSLPAYCRWCATVNCTDTTLQTHKMEEKICMCVNFDMKQPTCCQTEGNVHWVHSKPPTPLMSSACCEHIRIHIYTHIYTRPVSSQYFSLAQQFCTKIRVGMCHKSISADLSR